VDSINRHQIGLYVEKIKEASGVMDLSGIPVAVLGLGYKKGSSSITKSRGLELVKELLKQGAIVYATDEDTQAVTNARWIFEEIKKGEEAVNSPFNGDAKMWRSVPLENLHLVDSPKEAVRGTLAQVITTASNYFKEVGEIFPGAQKIRVVDGRHFFNEPEIAGLIALGGEYHAVGMPSRKAPTGKGSAGEQTA
jgi:UDP-glucose 6-dehydrogenase